MTLGSYRRVDGRVCWPAGRARDMIGAMKSRVHPATRRGTGGELAGVRGLLYPARRRDALALARGQGGLGRAALRSAGRAAAVLGTGDRDDAHTPTRLPLAAAPDRGLRPVNPVHLGRRSHRAGPIDALATQSATGCRVTRSSGPRPVASMRPRERDMRASWYRRRGPRRCRAADHARKRAMVRSRTCRRSGSAHGRRPPATVTRLAWRMPSSGTSRSSEMAFTGGVAAVGGSRRALRATP